MELEFKRELYIKNLYIPEQIINGFDFIEFNSYLALNDAINQHFFKVKEDTIVHVNVKNLSDFKLLKQFFETNRTFITKMNVTLLVHGKELLDKIMSEEIPIDFDVFIFSNCSYNTADYWKINSKWISKHVMGMTFNIKAETIATDMCRLVDYYNMNHVRFFSLKIDYESFSNVLVKDLDKHEYWFNYLRNWINGGKPEENKQPIVIMFSKFYRKIFVDDDLTLYLDSDKNKSWYFPLHSYLDKTGETISNDILNNLHKYLDLTLDAFYTKLGIYNWNLIDFNQIKKMGYYINEIPLIMGLVQRWLYGN